jgi:hypothetical protein
MDLQDVWDVLPIKTPHYNFNLEYFSQDKGHLFVGDVKNPCLSITFNLPDIRLLNSRFENMDISIGSINKIKNIKECVLETSEESTNSNSFPKEMLSAVIKEIKKSFPHIKHLQLQDTSYIPCDGDSDTLDLLVYSVALYKKTWYEKEFNAYFVPRDAFIDYKCKIEKYASRETKSKYSWNEFYTIINLKLSYYANTIFNEKALEYESIYESTKTFPEFFINISKTIPKSDKCKFFKDWLEYFLEYKMDLQFKRQWYIDLYSVQKGGTRKSRKTRKRRN